MPKRVESEDDLEVDEDDAQPAKRQRQEPAEYPRGTVKKVRVRNFMTYGDEVTIVPGPRLNLVLGPNGTGKSSLVCALCVGLAGSTKLLGRADNVKEYIKRDAVEGWVEVTLSGGPGQQDKRVRRQMKKEADNKYSSHYKINDAPASEKDVKKLVSDLNIQFDNLCQFLPQDKVTEFARLDAYELLLATEKAIGDASLYNTHQELISKREGVKQLEQAYAALEKQLGRAKAAVADLERDYERFRRRQQLSKKIELCAARQAYLRVEAHQTRFQEALQAANAAAAAADAIQREVAAKEGPLKPVKQKLEAATKELAKVAAKNSDVTQLINAASAAIDKAEEESEKVQGELEQLKSQSKARLKAIDKAREKVAASEAALAGLPPVPDNNGAIGDLLHVNKGLQDQLMGLGYEVNEATSAEHRARMRKDGLERQLNELANERYQRLEALSSSHQQLPAAHQWILEEKRAGRLRGEVYGPVGMEMMVNNKQYAGYLEAHMGRYLRGFIGTHVADEGRITAKLRELGLSVPYNTINLDRTPPPAQPGRFADMGVAATLDEVYDAPVLVKAFLRNNTYTHTACVMAGEDAEAASRVVQLDEVGTVYSGSQQMRCIRSAYGDRNLDSTFATNNVGPARVLGGASAAELQAAQANLQQQLAGVEAELAQHSALIAEKQATREPLQAAVTENENAMKRLRADMGAAVRLRQQTTQDLAAQRKQLATWERKPDPLDTQPALIAKLKRAAEARRAGLRKLLGGLQQQWALTQAWCVQELTWKELEMQYAALKADQQELLGRQRQLKAAAEAATAAMKQANAAFQAAQTAANSEYPQSAAERAAMQALPSDLAEVAALRSGYEEEVASIVCNNPRVAQEYSDKTAALADISEREAAAKQALATGAQEVEDIKAAWLPELQQVVTAINTSFSTNFAHIGCAGEVVLVEHADFDKYAMEVRVKFRESEPLQKLTAHRQSGGERSVSTILYLIALQGVTVTPFRVVDEINQGMDAINERKVFRHLVEASCAPGTPQCFLLTPKLLPDLVFTPDITVLQIFNGPLVEEAVARSFNAKDIYGARLAASQQQQQQQQRPRQALAAA